MSTSTQRWKRVFDLRRAFVTSIMLAGMRDGKPWVSLPDSLDETIYTALTKEAQLAQRQTRAVRGRHRE